MNQFPVDPHSNKPRSRHSSHSDKHDRHPHEKDEQKETKPEHTQGKLRVNRKKASKITRLQPRMIKRQEKVNTQLLAQQLARMTGKKLNMTILRTRRNRKEPDIIKARRITRELSMSIILKANTRSTRQTRPIRRVTRVAKAVMQGKRAQNTRRKRLVQ